jgi:hypothetical protein
MRAQKAEDSLLDLLKVKSGPRRRALTDDERRLLTMMLTMKRDPLALDVMRLVPKGSFLARVLRHFLDTDISFALPHFQTVMLAASWLTQNGAVLEIDGVGRIRPTLWTISLAESGSAKTLAADRMTTILGDGLGGAPVQMLPVPGTDAQWIVDLAENNGAFWLQDEVGKFFNGVLKGKLLPRIKPWMLSAYSHQPISNRLKTSVSSEIADPHFTFHGLSVFSTWSEDIDPVSMLDGFCQRPNYVVATERSDVSMFDHFLYFEGKHVVDAEADLRELWHALCAQPGAAGVYTLKADVLPYLRRWWSGLRHTWGSGGIPASFIRRIGYSVLRYLVVLHFLLGKSRYPVDVETAHLATKFAEFHLESTREMLEAYDRSGAQRVQKIMEIRSALKEEGQVANARNIHRRLGKTLREGLTADVLNSILDVLDRVDVGEAFPETPQGRQGRAGAIVRQLDGLEARILRNEQKRNERRLRNLRNAYRAAQGHCDDDSADTPSSCGSPEARAHAFSDGVSGSEQGADEDVLGSMFGFGAAEDSDQHPATVVPFPGSAGRHSTAG